MAALTDPRAFLSAQEKRAEQMKAMGIEESDIATKDLIGTESKKTDSNAAVKKPQPIKAEEKKAEDLKFEPITMDSLKTEKAFLKTLRKQQKEIESFKKRQLKEKMVIQKQQCVAIEKIIKGKK